MDANTSSQFAVPMLPTYGGGGGTINSISNRIIMPMASTSSSSSSSSDNFAVPNGSTSSNSQQAGVIRRRRFSTAKIQPTRIKKVMQSDEEIGRMVQSVPVSIGRAMEHFAEKFLQASADATQFTNSKTLTPQHMKQAMLCNPHFAFLDTVLKDIQIPQGIVEASTARTVVSQQNYQDQQNNEMANAILANAQMQLHQQYMDPLLMNGIGGIEGTPALGYPIIQDVLTPTTQLANDMMGMLKTAQQNSQFIMPARIQNGVKRASIDSAGDEDRKKRGRPKKKKSERCIDDDLFEEASRNVAKEDKDREMMPPPQLPGFIP
ncbi:unnamed protein product [Caenorhabditis angaria]|uniref:Transcription factor CBF/NF-Y/archaeal histone domain-containing protein n=1 Tax=Caenorhabditis angaria TaxID=860376 RepID=A0A9P1ISR2_9PELO|nr:unnamed protein product [Caenorhabditis angaria]